MGKLTVFLCAVFMLQLISAQNNLQCFDCESPNSVECENTDANPGVKVTNCDVKYNDRNANATLLCVSAYLKVTGVDAGQTGVYRDCRVQYANVENFCDWFMENNTTPNVTIASCRSCNTTRCNNHLFNADGSVNGSQMTSAALAFVILVFTFTVTI
ncbi:uncharacterized protein LOC132699328 isoform X2 [Cylas formicarius]|uniref:uncharacterized protein LOC132699328 isoform X2 n=1 Tax=Cylas formicarius TaxID=197179 RepID=UPI002958B2D6|nr:uncharacterized protein LOC132699328 isoform X2 [Cylas formicarius]